MKKNSLLILLLLICSGNYLEAQRTDQPWQLDIAAGLHSYYAPVEHVKWSRPELITTAAFNRLLGPRQFFSAGLQIGYARNNYQGDALFLQLTGQFTPVIAHKIEAGIGLGAGYRLALYPSSSLKWNGSGWTKGKAFKGIIQTPVQLSIGYRSVRMQSYEFRPYLAYQLQPLFRYNPDLSPLPVSNFLLGLKIHNYK